MIIIEKLKKAKEWVLSKILRPLRILQITCKCPLRSDCKDKIVIQIVTSHNDYTPEELFDYMIRSIGKHLAKAHNVKVFQGIEYKTETNKYTLMGSYLHKEK